MKHSLPSKQLISIMLSLSACDCYQKVSGTIIDKDNNTPIDSVQVVNIQKWKDNAVSDAEGFFEIRSISGGLSGCSQMTVSVSKTGYQADTLVIENGDSLTIQLSKLEK